MIPALLAARIETARLGALAEHLEQVCEQLRNRDWPAGRSPAGHAAGGGLFAPLCVRGAAARKDAGLSPAAHHGRTDT